MGRSSISRFTIEKCTYRHSIDRILVCLSSGRNERLLWRGRLDEEEGASLEEQQSKKDLGKAVGRREAAKNGHVRLPTNGRRIPGLSSKSP
jgi:hypothetical protein